MINKFGQYYKRKPIKSTLRLAVYERDNFTYQYCGCHVDATTILSQLAEEEQTTSIT